MKRLEYLKKHVDLKKIFFATQKFFWTPQFPEKFLFFRYFLGLGCTGDFSLPKIFKEFLINFDFFTKKFPIFITKARLYPKNCLKTPREGAVNQIQSKKEFRVRCYVQFQKFHSS